MILEHRPGLGIYKRKKESKQESNHAFDQEKKNSSKKEISRSRKKRSRSRKKEVVQEKRAR